MLCQVVALHSDDAEVVSIHDANHALAVLPSLVENGNMGELLSRPPLWIGADSDGDQAGAGHTVV